MTPTHTSVPSLWLELRQLRFDHTCPSGFYTQIYLVPDLWCMCQHAHKTMPANTSRGGTKGSRLTWTLHKQQCMGSNLPTNNPRGPHFFPLKTSGFWQWFWIQRCLAFQDSTAAKPPPTDTLEAEKRRRFKRSDCKRRRTDHDNDR